MTDEEDSTSILLKIMGEMIIKMDALQTEVRNKNTKQEASKDPNKEIKKSHTRKTKPERSKYQKVNVNNVSVTPMYTCVLD